MAKRLEVYKCELCGNIIEVLHGAGGTLVCCGQEMKLLVPTTTDGAVEKHVPVITKVDGGYKVVVGDVAHPMTDEHYIEWIELVAGDTVFTKFLNPGDAPEAFFATDASDVYAREHCTLHGHWKSK